MLNCFINYYKILCMNTTYNNNTQLYNKKQHYHEPFSKKIYKALESRFKKDLQIVQTYNNFIPIILIFIFIILHKATFWLCKRIVINIKPFYIGILFIIGILIVTLSALFILNSYFEDTFIGTKLSKLYLPIGIGIGLIGFALMYFFGIKNENYSDLIYTPIIANVVIVLLFLLTSGSVYDYSHRITDWLLPKNHYILKTLFNIFLIMLCLEMVDIIIFLINILMSILFNNSFKKYESMMLIDGDKVDEHVKIITPKQRDVNYKISETKHILGMTKLYGVFYQLIKCLK